MLYEHRCLEREKGKGPEVAALRVFLLLLCASVTALASGEKHTASDDREWGRRFGVQASDPTVSRLDYDHDGLNNLAESREQTDPFSADTDLDGVVDGMDAAPVSRQVIVWGDPAFTEGEDYVCTGTEWCLAAWKEGGDWSTDPTGWVAKEQLDKNIGTLVIELDRTRQSNDLVMVVLVEGNAKSTLYADFLDRNGTVLAPDICGELMSQCVDGTFTGTLPLEQNPLAVAVRLRRGSGNLCVRLTMLYEDQDNDGLDRDQEIQFGTLDTNPDTDADGFSDCDEVLRFFSDPTDPSDPAKISAHDDGEKPKKSRQEKHNRGHHRGHRDDPDRDVDTDGMPDIWETTYFGGISEMPDGDYDGDGTSNLNEYLQGRDPSRGFIPDTADRIRLNVFTDLSKDRS